MPGLLAEKIAIITGSGRGIGKATAAQFVREGATVIIAEFDHNTGKNCADERSFRNAVYMACDIYKKRQEYKTLTKNPLQAKNLKKKTAFQIRN